MSELQQVFNSFCAFGAGSGNAKAEMDNAKFAKFCKDTKLVDKKFSATDCDLIFSKVKPKGARKISYDCFKNQALVEIAARKGCTKDDVVAKVTNTGGPNSSGTVAESVKFHDDKSQYTGVHAKGGPTTNDRGTADLSEITNRGEADVRGVQQYK
eukprot:TRINITY_DN50313_c0_g1_i1.p3 TRINITY_DN50313_c0_g1~~TRINITY_DN50313_c0_g1_i1.p3  ORF type:complete len:155 (+),score=70.13 TRINITY_DN50313_c0_g1_i1:59-523(+)